MPDSLVQYYKVFAGTASDIVKQHVFMEENPTIFQDFRYQYTDSESNFAMASRNFNSSDFGAVAALTEDQLLTAVRDHPEDVLSRLCEKLDSLRADQVKALAIQNMYRSEEGRARLWYIGPNEEHVPYEEQANFAQRRTQQLKFCRDGIGLSAAWENRLKTITARVDGLYQYWAALCDKLDPYREEDLEGCHSIAQHILGEQRWLRDQDGIASVSLTVLANHRGVDGLNYVIDACGDLSSRGKLAKFTWVSFR